MLGSWNSQIETQDGVNFLPESRIVIYDLTGKKMRTLAAPKDGRFVQSKSIDWR